MEKIAHTKIEGTDTDEILSEKMFSNYTHPELEKFIKRAVHQNTDSFSELQRFQREFLLYGFMKATGQEFSFLNYDPEILERGNEQKVFYTNNGVLVFYDNNGDAYIRGGDSYHGCGSSRSQGGVEETLLDLGYDAEFCYVPHSNDKFADARREKLFKTLCSFSEEIRRIRGESSGMIYFSEQDSPALYEGRDLDLPTIRIGNDILIQGNDEKVLEF